jgi:hypothetical protein
MLAAKRKQAIAARRTSAKVRDSEIEISGNKKAPQKEWGAKATLFLAKSVSTTAARAGNLTDGSKAAHSGGTVADFHGLPRTHAC